MIPDFVLLPNVYRGKNVAFSIIEAKKSIKNDKELMEALDQVRSYALLLCAKYAVLASQEGIWITSKESNYLDFIVKYDWSQLSDDDVFYEVKNLIGKK